MDDASKQLQQGLFKAADTHLKELFKIISLYQETTDKLFADYNLKVASMFMTRLLQSGKVKGNVKAVELGKDKNNEQLGSASGTDRTGHLGKEGETSDGG